MLSCSDRVSGIQLIITSFFFYALVMCSAFNDISIVHDDDPVHVLNTEDPL
jgi:hypothetical protein